MPDHHPDAHQHQLTTAIMQAIFDQSLTEIDGEPTAIIRPLDAANALMTCLATILESSPTCNTPKGMRETAEELGKGLHRLMRDTRKLREAGHAPFPAEVFYMHYRATLVISPQRLTGRGCRQVLCQSYGRVP